MNNTKEKRAGYLAFRLSIYGGLAVMVIWFCYVAFLVLSNGELPDADELLSCVGVSMVLFALGWLAVRIVLQLLARTYRHLSSVLSR